MARRTCRLCISRVDRPCRSRTLWGSSYGFGWGLTQGTIRKELFAIDSASIKHEYIEKGDPEFRNVTQMRFEIKDGFFRYEARDSSGNVVKSFITALSYIHTIETRKDEPSREPGMPMHKFSKEEMTGRRTSPRSRRQSVHRKHQKVQVAYAMKS
jgi:hypothetical protein